MNSTEVKNRLKSLTSKAKGWLSVPANEKKAAIIIAGLAAAILLVILIYHAADWWHDRNYQQQQDNGNGLATNSQINANQHIVNANVSANKQKELEANENTIIQKQANQQKILVNDEQQSKNTRDALNKSLNQNVPDRHGDDGTDDDQLRTDANAAANAFNRARIKNAVTPKP